MTEQYVTYHHPKVARIWTEHAYLERVGLTKGTKLLFPKNIDCNKDTLFAPRLHAASGEPASIHTVSSKMIVGKSKSVVDIFNKRVAAWLEGYKGYFIHYTNNGLRITRLSDSTSGRCAKQVVVATLVTSKGNTFVGTNRCLSPQLSCPRDKRGMKSGEGYYLCKDICQQYDHAEADAIARAGCEAKGALIYLQGHSYACDSCKSAANKAGAQIIVAKSDC